MSVDIGIIGYTGGETLTVGIASQLAEEQKGQESRYKNCFPAKWWNQYHYVHTYWGIVDPDLVEPYVIAWLSRCAVTKEKFSFNGFYRAALYVPGTTEDAATLIASAAAHAYEQGRLSADAATLLFDPVNYPGNLSDKFSAALKKVVPNIIKGVETTASLIEYLPLIGVAVGIGWLFWFTAPARSAGKSVKEVFR